MKILYKAWDITTFSLPETQTLPAFKFHEGITLWKKSPNRGEDHQILQKALY